MGKRTMLLFVPGTPKSLRETLCVAQVDIARSGRRHEEVDAHLKTLQSLIFDIDVSRPLGPDGKHGDLHTHTCGCEDVQLTFRDRVRRFLARVTSTYKYWRYLR